jgi:hypothetical protein
MRIGRYLPLVLVFGVVAAIPSALATTEPREKPRIGAAKFLLAPIAPWKVFGPQPRANTSYRVKQSTSSAPTSTPVRLRPNRRFYIGPHYKSEYGRGYHTNGPGIGIVR